MGADAPAEKVVNMFTVPWIAMPEVICANGGMALPSRVPVGVVGDGTGVVGDAEKLELVLELELELEDEELPDGDNARF